MTMAAQYSPSTCIECGANMTDEDRFAARCDALGRLNAILGDALIARESVERAAAALCRCGRCVNAHYDKVCARLQPPGIQPGELAGKGGAS
jgi:alkylhydroperoxidase family enzyme